MRQRTLLAAAALLLAAGAAAVHLALGRPAAEEAARLDAERARLAADLDTLRAQLRSFQGQEPPSLPGPDETPERVAQIARILPPQSGYSIKTDTPQPFPPAAQPVAQQLRVLVAVEASYDRSVELARELAALPASALEELALARIPTRPGLLRASATVTLVFEGSAPRQALPVPVPAPGPDSRGGGLR